MLKQTIQVVAFIGLAIGTVGCTGSQVDSKQSVQCIKLKRELLYHDTNRNVEAKWSTAEQRAEFKRHMAEVCSPGYQPPKPQ